jgi:O-antigen/teichoic acid export membrane protein
LETAIASMCLARFCCNAIFLTWLLSEIAWLRAELPANAYWSLREFLKPGAGSAALSLSTILQSQGPVTVLGVFFGATVAGSYTAMRTIVNIGFQVLNAINNALIPEMARAWGSKRIWRLRYIHRLGAGVALVGGMIAVASLALVGPALFRLWTKEALLFDPGMFAVLLGNLVAMCLWYGSAAVPVATNQQFRLGTLYLSLSVVALGVVLYFQSMFGPLTVVAALLACNLAMCGFVIADTLRITNDSASAFMANALALPIKIARRALARSWKGFWHV